MESLYLGLGTNLGERQHLLDAALLLIEKRIGTVAMKSVPIETEPWGFSSVHSFLNMAVCVHTFLAPEVVLAETQAIERELGRVRPNPSSGKYTDRSIDIDILMYGSCVLQTPDLTIPHPLMAERLFVLQPMARIAPHLVHPLLHLTMQELLQRASSSQSGSPLSPARR